jgi:hypothetical protein
MHEINISFINNAQILIQFTASFVLINSLNFNYYCLLNKFNLLTKFQVI